MGYVARHSLFASYSEQEQRDQVRQVISVECEILTSLAIMAGSTVELTEAERLLLDGVSIASLTLAN